MQGDPKVDELMRPVLEAIKRHLKDSDAKTDIYNRAYEALMISMEVNKSRAEKAEAEVVRLKKNAVYSLNHLNEEVNQFNDGFDAAKAGKLESDEPSYQIDTDSWRVGFAWGSYEPMKNRIAELRSSLAALREQTRWRDILKPPDIGIDVEVLSRNGSVGIDRLAKRINEWTEQEEIDWEGVGGLYTHWRPIDLPETDKEGKE